MKVTVDVRMEVEVDTAAWQQEYGNQPFPFDAENYLLTQINGSPAAEAGCLSVEGYAFHPRKVATV